MRARSTALGDVRDDCLVGTTGMTDARMEFEDRIYLDSVARVVADLLLDGWRPGEIRRVLRRAEKIVPVIQAALFEIPRQANGV